MNDAIITAEYLEQVAENIDDAMMDAGLAQRTVKVSVGKSDANTMREAAALLREMETQLAAARREAAEAQAREQWHIQKANELHEFLIKEPNVKGALDLAEHYLRMMRSSLISDTALSAAIEQARREEREAWFELTRRLYIELFHVDQQLCWVRGEDDEPIYRQGITVRDVLADAKRVLEGQSASVGEEFALPQWKPIETAPKDGTVILSCVAHEHLYSPCAAVWATYHPNASGKPCWRTSRICGNKLNPTHWMPLPDLPGIDAARKGGA